MLLPRKSHTQRIAFILALIAGLAFLAYRGQTPSDPATVSALNHYAEHFKCRAGLSPTTDAKTIKPCTNSYLVASFTGTSQPPQIKHLGSVLSTEAIPNKLGSGSGWVLHVKLAPAAVYYLTFTSHDAGHTWSSQRDSHPTDLAFGVPGTAAEILVVTATSSAWPPDSNEAVLPNPNGTGFWPQVMAAGRNLPPILVP